MLVGELLGFISDNGLSRNAKIILSKDAEGNNFEYLDESEVVEGFEGIGYGKEEAAGRNLLLWPVN